MADIKTCTIIYNPVATSFNNTILENAVEKLKSRGIETTVIKSNKAGHVIPLIKKYNPLCDLILTLGGDGTVGEAFQGYYRQEQHALYSHLSTGTTNDVVANFNLVPGDMLASLDKILDGKVRDIDILTVNNDPFAYISCFGYVASVPFLTPHTMKRRMGYAGYVLYGMKEVAKGPRKMQVSYTKNGELLEAQATMIVVSNTRRFSGIDIFQDAILDDGMFEVLMIKSLSVGLIATLMRDFFKNNARLDSYGENVEYFRTNDFFISFDNKKQNIDLCHDGDRYRAARDENLSLHYKVSGRLQMLLPVQEECAK